MILLIDNFDSFTYNIRQYLAEMNLDVLVRRNNAITPEEIETLSPTHIVISPGPGRPEDAGVIMEVIKTFKGRIPILGICLGHQAIGAAFGTRVIRAAALFHGKTSSITHDGKGCFNGLKNPFTAVRYHSLALEKISLSPDLEITATSGDGEIMGVRHKHFPIEGVQFHPESIATECGKQLLQNFIRREQEKPTVRTALQKIFSGAFLSEDEASRIMEDITSGNAAPAQIAGLLTALAMRGESVAELTGFARVMRKKATPIPRPQGKKILDTCGTGGDASNTFNISTLSAFVAAGCGVTVAKHGNRSVTSHCGSADLLEALGVNLSVHPDLIAYALDRIGVAFLFAPKLHDSMKHAVPVRKELGIRTVFNLLGPLSNPAAADFHLMGVFSNNVREKIAHTLVNLGVSRAMIVHGHDGLDEITLTGKTFISEVNNGWVKNYQLDPHDYNMDYCSPDDLKGGDLKTNREIALAILQGQPGPKRNIVLLNAAAAIHLTEENLSFSDALKKAAHAIDSGLAIQKLEELSRMSTTSYS